MNAPRSSAARSALNDGHIVVVMLVVPGVIETARAAARQVCVDLLQMAGSGPTNISRSATLGHAAVAFSRCGPVGVDVERLQPNIVDDVLLALALHPSERSEASGACSRGFFDLWVRKEALLKMLGVGLAVPPAQVNVGPAGLTWRSVKIPNIGEGYVRNLHSEAGLAAALAVREHAPLHVVRGWQPSE